MKYWNEKIETMPRRELDELIDKKVGYTAKYAYEFSPYYHQLFKQVGIKPDDIQKRSDLRKIPIVNGKIILENQPPNTKDFLFFSVPSDKRARFLETSGTAAQPKSFCLSFDDYDSLKDEYARAYVAGGIKKGDVGLNLCPYGMNISGLVSTQGMQIMGASVVPLGISLQPSKLSVIEKYKPNFISALTSFICRYTKELEKGNVDVKNLGIKKIFVGGEPLAEDQKIYLNNKWNAETFNLYAATETFLAYECSSHNGLHLAEDYAIFDILDEETNEPVGGEEEGIGVLTTLVEPGKFRGMTLINYNIEDIFKNLNKDVCECGRTLVRISPPERRGDIVNVGAKLSRTYLDSIMFRPEILMMGFENYIGIRYYDKNEQQHVLDLLVEVKDDFSENSIEYLERQILGSYELGETAKRNIFRLNINPFKHGKIESAASKYPEEIKAKIVNLYTRLGKPKKLIDIEFWLESK